MKAIDIIRSEHRSLAAVLEAMRYLTMEIGAGRIEPDFHLFGAMVYYVEAFPEKLHHPKESDYLFRALRERRPGLGPVLDELEREHVAGRDRIGQLKQALAGYRRLTSAGYQAFADELERYVAFELRHMTVEEERVLPAAAQALTVDDWTAIDAAFSSNQDPIGGVVAKQELPKLLRAIMQRFPRASSAEPGIEDE
jgi:hemerythrin-like domain-containing protein